MARTCGPRPYIVDKKGRIAYKVVGPKDWTSSEVLKFWTYLLLRTLEWHSTAGSHRRRMNHGWPKHSSQAEAILSNITYSSD
jgi:hypothetical protein